MLLSKFRSEIYILIHEDTVLAKNLNSKDRVNLPGKGAFKHPRSLVSDFKLAVSVVKDCIEKVNIGSFVKPKVLLHWSPELEGGFSPVEARVLSEMAREAGAREVYLHTSSNEISINDVKRALKKHAK